MIIFVGGASGIGKTTICRRVASTINSFIHLKFFRCIREEAGPRSQEDRLRQWDKLQLSMINNRIVPLLHSGKNIIFDMHFSFQRTGGANIAFAKSGFNSKIEAGPSYSEDFMKLLISLDTPISLILLKEDSQIIQSRQKFRSKKVLSKEVIEKEQSAEELYWQQFCRELKILNSQHISMKINNHDLDLTISAILENIESLKE